MIKKIRHRGLRKLYERDDASGLNENHAPRLRRILTALDAAQRPSDMDLPGWRLHPLTGNRKGEWSVTVSGNWRVTFSFDGDHATDVKLEDYH